MDLNPIPTTCIAAVMTAPGTELEFREYPVPQPSTGEVLVRVHSCTICRSDLHSWKGKRHCATPIILGHEIVGEIVAVGPHREWDWAGNAIAVGDRLTWTMHSCCGQCIYCQQYELPMKCQSLRKYGHDSCENAPHLRGGFAEYCLIDTGTAILKLPDNIPYPQAAPLNCAAATVIAGLEAADLKSGESVLIQGAGGLGCYAAAFARLLGAKNIVVSDINSDALKMVERFGATATLDLSQMDAGDAQSKVRSLTGGLGVDCALELAGVPSVVPHGLAALRKGGRYVEIGCSFPDAIVQIDLSSLLWNRLTIAGIHNYDVRHLQRAMQLVSQSIGTMPYEQLIARSFSLHEINQALAYAESKAIGRVAISV